ncbi:hypothetical protein DVH05_002606 [Phytophthora capsici]|nr:hypothetical protein DVH05_002606 [Phytophthora capsici]
MLLHNWHLTDTQRQSFTPDCQSAKYETTLRQLDHVQQLLITAKESLSVTLDAPDYMVATQCYTMALEQLTAMVRTLERRGARKK